MQGKQKMIQLSLPFEEKAEKNLEGKSHSIDESESNQEHTDKVLERILDWGNISQACEKVIKNKGAAGIDGITVKEIKPILEEHYQELVSKILSGKYKPKAVKRIEIPKPDGGVRNLGIPTVLDRVIQQAIVQILEPMFEPKFSDSSYGFRPHRSAHQAMQKTLEYYQAGYKFVVDMDLAKYFDTVNHDILINRIREVVKDERVIKLIRAILKSGVMINGVKVETEEGTPQGGNLSPLLSNIYLTAFDKLLESRGHKFARYADDCNIYARSLKAAMRIRQSCENFLEKKLKLKVNQEKTQVGSPIGLKFLGFTLYETTTGKVGIRPHQKAIKKFKDKIREKTNRTKPMKIEEMASSLSKLIRGWISYFALTTTWSYLGRIFEWIRRRMRQFILRQWKKPNAIIRNLCSLGTSKDSAIKIAYSSKGKWRLSLAKAIHIALNTKYLRNLLKLNEEEFYYKMSDNIRTAVCRTARTVV